MNSQRKQRVWVSRAQLDALKTFIFEKFEGKTKVFASFDEIVNILGDGGISDPQNSRYRIVWSRSCREFTQSIGIKVSIRNKRGGYILEIIDQGKWLKAISGQSNPSPIPASVHVPLPAPAKVESIEDILNPKISDPLIPAPDPLYHFPSFAGDLLKSIMAGEKTLLVGGCGTGKSSLVTQLASRSRAKFMRINLSGESTVASLIGQWKIQAKEMVFAEGPVTKAVKLGRWLCIDEIDAAVPAVLFALQALLEDDGKLLIEETGEWHIPHPDFRVIATANTKGKGDDSGLYAGTNVLNEAFLDRFHAFFEVDYLPPAEETKLLIAKVPALNRQTADRMVKAAVDLRKANREGLTFSPFSFRRLLSWAKKSIQLNDPKRSAIYTVLNRLSDDDRKVVSEVLQRHGF